MTSLASTPQEKDPAATVGEWIFSLLLGAGFTLMIFMGLAHLETAEPTAPPVELNRLRSVTLAAEPPPPPPAPRSSPAVTPTLQVPAISGIESDSGDARSRLKVVATPSQLGLLMPPTPVPAEARIRSAPLYSDFKPRIDVEADFRDRVFQQTEVDRRPQVLAEGSPYIPPIVRGQATFLRLVLLILIDTMGQPANIRVLHSSGNPAFDDIMVECVKRRWLFSPAIKNGVKVRCLAQRTITVKWASTPFGY